ncbi:MAG: hypothetical protein JNK78_01535 [Planctomycetes bacterium]|nr:hypothetical protein [Planctomycetota bacterium]
MIRRTTKHLFAALLALAPSALVAQSDTKEVAAAVVRSLVPATDDPDAAFRDLVTTAMAQRRSPAAWVLAQEAIWLVNQLQDPSARRDELKQGAGGERLHGRLEQKLTELRWWLDRACDGPMRAGAIPALGYCKHAVVVGPLGDAGEHFVGIPMAPEFRFPALGAELPGRGHVARVRRVDTRLGSDYVEFHSRAHALPGCYYALQRFAVDAPIDGFLEVEFDGDFQLFVDGSEMLRVERWKATAPRRHYVAVHMPAGEHTTLMKACSFEKGSFTMRWLDADAAPLTAVRQIAIEDTSAPIGERATPSENVFVTADALLARAAEQPDAAPELRIAAILVAERENNHDLTLRLCEPLRRTPPADPLTALAFARVLRYAPMPDALRRAEARKIEEPAIAALPPEHHAARMANVALLSEQDQREKALRLLADHPAPGPATFQRRHALVRELKFAAEEIPLLEQWAAKCPHDPRPVNLLADAAASAADGARAVELRKRAASFAPDLQNATRAVEAAIDVGDAATAAAWIDAIAPLPDNPRDLGRVSMEGRLFRASGDDAALTPVLQEAIRHPDASPDFLFDLAGQCARQPAGKAATIACLQRSLDLDPDQPKVRAWLAELGELPPEDATFAPFRRDADAVRKAFTAGEREQTASSTVLIDQRIVELHADGSWTSETHELRRINDQAGVDAFRTAAPLDDADEVLLVRTIGADGRIWVPAKVENEYALQRLEPGVFIEWRYRERGAAPGADPAHAGSFYFGSESEPLLLSEFVVIAPAGCRASARSRGFGEPTETRDLDGGRKATIWRRENLPALPREQFLPPLHEIVPFVEVGEDAAPFAALRRTRVEILRRTRPVAPIQAKAKDLFAGLEGRAVVEAAWKWCNETIESGPADSALDTLLLQKGSRFLLVAALLRAAGLDVAPTACHAFRAGASDDSSLFADQDPFDATGAVVSLADGERIHMFIDTPRHWPLGAVPAGRAGTSAMVLRDDGNETVVLPSSDAAMQTLRIRGDATIDGSEIRIDAVAEIGDLSGFGLADRLRELKENQQKLAARQIAQQIFSGFRVRNAQIVDAAPGRPLRIQATVGRAGVQAKGDGFVMQLPVPPMKFVANFGDRAERTLPFLFPGDVLNEWQIDVDAGATHRFVDCPAPVSIRSRQFEHDLQVVRVGDKLRFSRRTRVLPGSFPANRFGEWLRALTDADRADQVTVDLATKG